MKLTGQTRYRTNWSGKLILQAEVSGEKINYMHGWVDRYPFTNWRDAKVEDLPIVMRQALKGGDE